MDVKNPFDLSDEYLKESGSEAFKRLQTSTYTVSDYSAANDAFLILTHWYEDIQKPKFNLAFYRATFDYIAALTFIFIKAYGLKNGTLRRPLPDEFIGHILDAIEARPTNDWLPLLNTMSVIRNINGTIPSEFRETWLRVLSLQYGIKTVLQKRVDAYE